MLVNRHVSIKDNQGILIIHLFIELLLPIGHSY
jgi:hypothetical protein